MDAKLESILDAARGGPGRVVVLTGAGISAESGIPTFRGPEGYWTVGSTVYEPQEIATWEFFSRSPAEVWRWYLWRLGVCREARPNPGHLAVAELERGLGDRFALVTQNVDGLHLRAGNSRERTYEIHGSARSMRCSHGCSGDLEPLPDAAALPARDAPLAPEAKALLTCRRCGAWMRPHVLWFDECYDEENYRIESAVRAGREAELLLVVGTSGATTGPNLVVDAALRSGAALVDVNPEKDPFAERAERLPRGAWVQAASAAALPGMVGRILGHPTPS